MRKSPVHCSASVVPMEGLSVERIDMHGSAIIALSDRSKRCVMVHQEGVLLDQVGYVVNNTV